LKPLLKQAEGLYILLKQYDKTKPGLPLSISAMIFSDRNNPNQDDEQDLHLITTSRSISNIREHFAQPKTHIRHFSESYQINGNNKAFVSPPKTS
jgi:hypothetical protein